ncbi:MAG: J domain-containing protein [Elusimicrobiota bacterium]
MDRPHYEKMDIARKLLGLEEKATLKEIRDSYRRLSSKYHPDRCGENKKHEYEEMFKEINNAYGMIMDYCAGYKYSFLKKSVEENDPDKDYREHMERFYDDWFGGFKRNTPKKIE